MIEEKEQYLNCKLQKVPCMPEARINTAIVTNIWLIQFGIRFQNCSIRDAYRSDQRTLSIIGLYPFFNLILIFSTDSIVAWFNFDIVLLQVIFNPIFRTTQINSKT